MMRDYCRGIHFRLEGGSGGSVWDRVKHWGILKPSDYQSNPFCLLPPGKAGCQSPGERPLPFEHHQQPTGRPRSWKSQDQPQIPSSIVMEGTEEVPIATRTHHCVCPCYSPTMSAASLEQPQGRGAGLPTLQMR